MQELIESYNRGQERLKKYADKGYILKNCLLMIWQAFESSAWFNLLNNENLKEAKQSFNDCGFTDLEECKFNSDIFGYKRNSPLYAALSDNSELINQFSSVDYILQSGPKNGKSFKEIAQTGENHIYIDSIIKSMNKDYDGLSLNLQTMDSVFMKKKKNAAFEADMDFFRGLLNKDKDKVFESINLLATKKHKSRNRHSFFYEDIVSQPAMGYAKIAWINGLELEFDLPLIHNELLPVKPLDSYEDNFRNIKKVMTYKPEDPNHNKGEVKRS